MSNPPTFFYRKAALVDSDSRVSRANAMSGTGAYNVIFQVWQNINMMQMFTFNDVHLQVSCLVGYLLV